MLALEACGCSEVRKGKVTEEHVRLPGERQVTNETSEMGESDGRVIGGAGSGSGGAGRQGRSRKASEKENETTRTPSRQITSPGRR